MPTKRKAFTLFELLMVMMILVIVMGAAVAAFIAGAQVMNTEMNTTDNLIEANRGMDNMSGDMRNALDISAATATSITFWGYDNNGNGSKEASENITYSWDGTANGNLIKTTAGTSFKVCRNVKNFTLTYDNGTISLIKQINIKLSVSQGPDISTLETTVKPRNL